MRPRLVQKVEVALCNGNAPAHFIVRATAAMKHCTKVFPSVDYAFTTIPTYPSGQIGFMVCTDGAHPVNKPVRSLSPPQLCQAAALQGWTGPAVCARCGRTRLRRSCATTAARSTGHAAPLP